MFREVSEKVLGCGIPARNACARNWRNGVRLVANATNLQSFATKNELT